MTVTDGGFDGFYEDMRMNIKSLALGAALGLGAAGAAHAATFTAFDLQPTSTVSLFSPETFSLEYDTTGWASIDSATLYLTLGDDGDRLPEAAVSYVSGNGSASVFLTTPISTFTGYSLGSVLDLVALGGTSLTGTVFGVGDFLYGGATLVLEYTPEFTPIPEASELWMLAAGLLAVGGIAVKRRSLGQV
ncbi:hypothetical protein [Immundisolibacter sp.]|uniref:hypothetical protein n=1 Tax=Immundisolibacter sp. TaxID=1934948 RepID=UPI002B0CF721|nr:hypothetical protein [Immundisolibacter sp.]MEA3219829.1 hypothetical protein [Immundisolibacter sp.]